MSAYSKEQAIEQIDNVLTGRSNANMITSGVACIERLTGPSSVYAREARAATKNWAAHDNATFMAGRHIQRILQGIRADIEAGYIESIREEIHEEIAADMLSTAAQFLVQNGKSFETASAVLAGGVLETHIRLLCDKNSIDTKRLKNGKPEPKNLDAMNNELASKGVYGKLDQGFVTSWYRIRTDAAHARYDEYDKFTCSQHDCWNSEVHCRPSCLIIR